MDDAVFALLELQNKVTGVLSVNWSEGTFRKMTTSVTISGKKGKIVSDANELKVWFKEGPFPEGYSKGWNVRHVTDLTPEVDYYLRGEEYSAQMDHFIKTVAGKASNTINTFESAWLTDRAISSSRKNKLNHGKDIIGDNQFFAVNHISDEKFMAQSMKFKEDAAIIKTLDIAREAGVETFMCTTHDRIANICEHIRNNPENHRDFKIFPRMPYAHKYANAVTELGIAGTLKQYAPGNFFGSLFKGGWPPCPKIT
ncbi:MAG: hypothetical protein MZV64_01660 [Ignavibacteriales bacterium]|nr:hypothetical protein [Ignavibacteriales bacterium]